MTAVNKNHLLRCDVAYNWKYVGGLQMDLYSVTTVMKEYDGYKNAPFHWFYSDGERYRGRMRI